ncbi:MAG: hypothetical protein ACFFCW_38755 [Candidatus Hodarchaeota archaeon]
MEVDSQLSLSLSILLSQKVRNDCSLDEKTTKQLHLMICQWSFHSYPGRFNSLGNSIGTPALFFHITTKARIDYAQQADVIRKSNDQMIDSSQNV